MHPFDLAQGKLRAFALKIFCTPPKLIVDDKAYWIALTQVTGIGAVRFAALLELCGSAQAAWRASVQQMRGAGLDRRAVENLLEARRQVDPARELARVERAGVQALTLEDDAYPENLREIDFPPPVLYVSGALQAVDDWAVAIVGTRRASAYGREVAQRLAAELTQHGVTVVSGLALGVDAVAHGAAMEAGGRTIAVLGSGLDQVYPARNRGLATQMIAGSGAVVSEYALGVRPEARNFPPRNRIISGLSRAVIVVEAGTRSGALITAKFAAEQGRDVLAVPGNILHAGSVGCNELIREGATPLLTVDDVLERLDIERQQAQRSVRQSVPAEPQEAQILQHLSADPSHVDEIVRQSALPSSQVNSLLTLMELKGLVRQVNAMQYVRV